MRKILVVAAAAKYLEVRMFEREFSRDDMKEAGRKAIIWYLYLSWNNWENVPVLEEPIVYVDSHGKCKVCDELNMPWEEFAEKNEVEVWAYATDLMTDTAAKFVLNKGEIKGKEE